MKKQNMIVKTIGLWLITLVSLSFANAKEMQPNDVINFPDKNFEKAIREKIRKPKGDILYSDISKITRVYFDDEKIKSIEGIQYFKSLTTLHLSKNKITDISSLKDLIKLEILEFSKNKITDISPLKNLVNLKYLHFSNNKIIDINLIKNLTKLQNLSLNKNNITDYSAISSLPKLEYISFEKGDVVDIANYSKLKNITFRISWKDSKGKLESWEIKLDKIKHLGKVTLDDEFIKKYTKRICGKGFKN